MGLNTGKEIKGKATCS